MTVNEIVEFWLSFSFLKRFTEIGEKYLKDKGV